jgi:hypothetical protein
MIVSICAPTFDLGGQALIQDVKPDGMLGFRRRNNRIATLDGDAAFNDFGYSEADRTFDVQWTTSDQDQVETIRRMAKTYSRVIVSTNEGCYIGAPGQFNFNNGSAQIQILVEKRIDQ